MAPLKNFGMMALLVSAGFLGACRAVLGGEDGTLGGGGEGDGSVVSKPAAFSPVVMRRLNRDEYDATVRDLLGTELRPGRDFPADDLSSGFPTVGAALSLSPAYVLAYEAAAHAIVEDLFASPERLAVHVPCDVIAGGDECARTVLGELARRAWRRPVTAEEVTGLLHPLEVARTQGATPIEGLRHAMAAVLLSPYFLFKVEVSAGALDGYEMATRLSYSLWGTMPDEPLFAAAASGELLDDAGLAAQVGRMLEDPRARALVDHFAARWLDYHDLEKHEVNAAMFPEFSPALAESMKEEANAFFYDALVSNMPVPDMLTSQHTFVDESLGAHYGLASSRPAETPAGPWRVDATPASRGGLLTLGALLTHTSLTSRTSPVKRGDFVFKHMLCGNIPPPPPGVEGVPDSGEAAASETLRQRMERHSQDPSCKGCHQVMDPIGFGLENYDAIGRFRTQDGSQPVDASGVMPDETTFNGAQELAQILADDPRFAYCVTKHFMTYSLGSVMKEDLDEQWAKYLTQETGAVDGSLRTMITQVVLSPPFRNRMP